MRHLINRVLRWLDAYVFYAAFCWLQSHKRSRWLARVTHRTGLQSALYRMAEFRLKGTR